MTDENSNLQGPVPLTDVEPLDDTEIEAIKKRIVEDWPRTWTHAEMGRALATISEWQLRVVEVEAKRQTAEANLRWADEAIASRLRELHEQFDLVEKLEDKLRDSKARVAELEAALRGIKPAAATVGWARAVIEAESVLYARVAP